MIMNIIYTCVQGLLMCFMILHCCFKDFVMAAVLNRKRSV